jgi:hypothetical protein
MPTQVDVALDVGVLGVETREVCQDLLITAPEEPVVLMDAVIAGGAERSAGLDVYKIGSVRFTIGMEVYKSFYFVRSCNASVAVKSIDERVTSKMDLAVLVPTVPGNVFTTPADSRYVDCRPIWCKVPKMHRRSSLLDAVISGHVVRTAVMDMAVQGTHTCYCFVQVLCDL